MVDPFTPATILTGKLYVLPELRGWVIAYDLTAQFALLANREFPSNKKLAFCC